MKILHVIYTLDPKYGGPPIVVTRLASAQAALGHEVTILHYPLPGGDEPTAVMLKQVPGLERVTIRNLPTITQRERLTAKVAQRVLDELVPQMNVLHLHGIWELLIKTAGDTARRCGVPYVVVPHGMLEPWALRQRWWKKYPALALGYKRMLNGSLFIHALNEDEKRLMAPRRLTCPIRVIPNGIFLQEVTPLPTRGTFRAAYPAVGQHPYVLFLSRIHYKKGPDYLADAFAIVAKQFSDLRLVVAGPDGGAQADFQRRIAAAGLTDRVVLTGPIYGPEKLAALVDSHLFCLPSRAEGFSIAITEALACRTPVVITENCHFPEVAEVNAGIVTPLDAQAVADGIARVMNSDDATRAAMGQAGRTLVETRFTWPAVAEQTLAEYRNAMTGSPDAILTGQP